MPVRLLAVSLLIILAGCGATPAAEPHDSLDAGSGSDGGAPSSEGWTWLPIEGSRCASGATAGIGINESTASDDLFIFMQGGGACWNQGTCVPSLLKFGPICHYGSNLCLYDGPGGIQPTASHVTARDPFPADGGGVFPSELKLITSSRAFDRTEPSNPFRDATFVFVPYCTGDLHTGDAVRSYKYRHDLIGEDRTYTFHFSGAVNMQRYLERLAAMRPNAKRIWLTGSSAGGYGATFHFERVQQTFPDAEVALLADSSPFVDAPLHWAEWRDTWNMQLPEGCADCRDGFPQVMAYLAGKWPDRRMGLLAFEEDAVVAWFFYGGVGPEAALNPPTGVYRSRLLELEALFDSHPNLAYFRAPGRDHVMWGGYGTRRSDGSWTEPRRSPDGQTDLRRWIDAWATGDAAWKSVR